MEAQGSTYALGLWGQIDQGKSCREKWSILHK